MAKSARLDQSITRDLRARLEAEQGVVMAEYAHTHKHTHAHHRIILHPAARYCFLFTNALFQLAPSPQISHVNALG